jgi:hypothetical protein
MPAAPTPIRLTEPDIPRVSEYLENAKHKNHRAYNVQEPDIRGAANAKMFFTMLQYAMMVINSGRSDRERIETAAFWYVFSFGKKSNLSLDERKSYEQVIIAALGCAGFCYLVWHTHRKNGEADLNVLVPHIRLSPFPELSRSRKLYRLGRARRRSDEWARKTNQAREDAGRPPMPVVDIYAEDSGTGLARLGRLIIGTLPTSAESFTRSQLRPAMERAGFKRGDWDLSISDLLRIHRWPHAKQKCRRPFQVRARELVDYTWLLLSRRIPRRRSKDEKDPRHSPEVHAIRGLRTAPVVLQADTISI